MKILFVYERFIVGGIETLMIRMKSWLEANGHTVIVLIGEKPESDFINSLGENVIVAGTTGFHLHCYPFASRHMDQLANVGVIFSFSKTSFAVALGMALKLKLRVPVVAGVFGPWIFEYERGTPGDQIVKIFDHDLPDRNKVFMSNEIKLRHEMSFNRAMAEAHAWSLPIDTKKLGQLRHLPRPGKIVSIGRISSFKTYNLYMVDIINRLNDEGFDVEWHVYGDEDLSDRSLKNEMRKRIDSIAHKDKIFLHGNIEYEELPRVLQDAFGFVGMGTALVEAAACGVPGVLAVAEETEGKTYGYFSELPHGVLGESIPGKEMHLHVYDLLKELLTKSPDEYRSECKASRNQAALYSLDSQMEKFVDILESARKFKRFPMSLSYARYVSAKTRRKLAATLAPYASRGMRGDEPQN